jgi:Fic family protein
MDAKLFAAMISDRRICDLKRMQHKYSSADVAEFIDLLKNTVYTVLPLRDFSGKNLVYLENVTKVGMNAVKLLLAPQNGRGAFGIRAMEDELHATLTIENIESSRDSVRKILSGYAPADESENRIYGMKKGLELIADPDNKITEANLNRLYQMTVGDFLDEQNKLLPASMYRHDDVFIIGGKAGHKGLPHAKLPEYMSALIAFANRKDEINDLIKAGIIHFYIGYLHPYFDGNGRTARLAHLWYLVQQGYSSAMHIPFSFHINDSRKGYHNAYSLAEQNEKISDLIDVTPFLVYLIENVYNKLRTERPQSDAGRIFQKILCEGNITEKERDLWNFVLSAYGPGEFSTKRLERDFGNAAYATVRSFVLKFEALGLLSKQKYANRIKYRVC